MKKLNQKEINEYESRCARGLEHEVIAEIIKMDVGEVLFVSFKEWKKKTPLNVYVGNYKLRRGIRTKIRTVKNEGWMVEKL